VNTAKLEKIFEALTSIPFSVVQMVGRRMGHTGQSLLEEERVCRVGDDHRHCRNKRTRVEI